MRTTIKIVFLFTAAIIFTSCASSKLSKTMWHNLTVVPSNGVMTTVGTSMYFNSDSTVVVYKSASLDTVVLYEPFLFAQGKYHCKKGDKGQLKVRLDAQELNGSPYILEGEYNKKTGLMILSKPDSKNKVTYVLNVKK